MTIRHYLREIGRGARGARSLDREPAAELFGLLLDGQVDDLSLGAFCLAMRVKGETTTEMHGFLDATQARLARLPASERPVVVLPSYNGARRLPVLTPLLALLLARDGWPVLLHGAVTEATRVPAQAVLAQFGVAPRHGLAAVAAGEIAVLTTDQLCPGLQTLLDVRKVLGLRNSAHSVVKLIQPVAGPSLVISNYTHPAFGTVMTELFEQRPMTGLLSRGMEGEPVCDPRREPRIHAFVAGVPMAIRPLADALPEQVPGLPGSTDVEPTVDYIRRVLAGELPLPGPIALQLMVIQTLLGSGVDR